STMACIRCLQQRSSKLPLRACLSFQYLSCFAKYLAKNFNSAVSSISCVFAEPIEAFGSTMACIRCLQQRSSKLPLRACLSFQYLSCFANYLAKISILQFPQFHVCLQSLLTRLAARWRV